MSEIKYYLSLVKVISLTCLTTTLQHFGFHGYPETEKPLSYKLATELFREMLNVEDRIHTLGRVRNLFAWVDGALDWITSPQLLKLFNIELKKGNMTFDLELIQEWEDSITPDSGGYIMPREVQDGIDGLLNSRNPSTSYTINLEFIRTRPSKKVILFAHGGGYCFLTPTTCRHLSILLSKVTGCDVLAVDYRKAGENPFPAALHDMLAAYTLLLSLPNKLLLNSTLSIPQYSPENIYLFGDSAGGGISLSFLVYLHTFLPPLFPHPRAIILSSPFIDLTCTHPSWKKNARVCSLPEIIGVGKLNKKIYLKNGFGGSPNPVWGYVSGWSEDIYSRQFWVDVVDSEDTLEEGGFEKDRRGIWMERMVLHPCVSPSRSLSPTIFEEKNGYKTRMLVQSGEREVLLDEAHELIARLSSLSSESTFSSESTSPKQIVHQIFQDMHHDFILFGDGVFLGPRQINMAFQRIEKFIRDCDLEETSGIEKVFVNRNDDSLHF
jgi:acetyl esterase/lipase